MAFIPMALGTIFQMISQRGIDAAQQAMITMDETQQLMLQAQELQHQEAMDRRSEVFNEAVQERSERMRERELLMDLDMSDRKIDDKITKEWIGLIRGQ
jgi:isocitrate dehydrogenase kinase/phosphatase